MLSVIMPAYNSQDYIKEAILSVLNQTFKDFELIVVNDASTDNTLKIAEEMAVKDKRIQVIHLRVNRNCGGDRCANIGLKFAQGKYIARMDADDIADRTRFEKQVKYLENHPEVFLVGSNAHVIDRNGKIIGDKIEPLSSEEIYKAYFGFHPMIHPTCVFRSTLKNGDKFYYQIKYSANNDYYTFFKLVCQGYKFVNLEEKLLQYRIHNHNATFVNMRKKFVNSLRIRLYMIFRHRYIPTLKDLFVLSAQTGVMFVLPERVLLKIYFLAKGIIRTQDLVPSFSFARPKYFSPVK